MNELNQAGNQVLSARLARALLLMCVCVLEACSTRKGTGSSQPPGASGSSNAGPTKNDAAVASGAPNTAATSVPSTMPNGASSALWPAVPPSAQSMDGGAPAQMVGLTPEQLVAMYCQKYPACAKLTCGPSDMLLQRAVCPPNNIAVCECVLKSVGQ